MSLKVGALFAGYGGIELALASALDTEPAWFSEFDKAPSAILAHHWPDVPNLGDVTKIDWAAVEPVDIITGGSPCQDLSHAGKRAGMKAGTRSGLWASMCDAIDIIRPRLVVWENVRGALSAEADSAVEPCPICVGDGGRVSLRALGRVLGDLAELGYDASWYGLRAADVGAAHGRWRVFVFAQPADAVGSGLEGLADQAGAAPAERHGHAVEGAGGPAAEHVPGQLTLLPTPAVNDMGAAYTPETWDAWTERMKAEHGNGNGHGKSLNIEALRLLKTPTSQLAVNGGSQHPDKRKDGGHGPTLADEVEHLLPTPRATDGTKGGPNQRGSSGDLMLPSAVVGLTRCAVCGCDDDLHDGDGFCAGPCGGNGYDCGGRGKLLPTPRATRGGSGTETLYGLGAERSDENRPQGEVLLPTPRTQNNENRQSEGYGGERGNFYGLIHGSQDWREYEAAIRRQEHAFGRPAPLPTEPGAKGQPRLSPRFVEWLMGLPEGHVTDPAIGISRNDQLKALGNGVVPQQCAAALRAFLTDTQERAA